MNTRVFCVLVVTLHGCAASGTAPPGESAAPCSPGESRCSGDTFERCGPSGWEANDCAGQSCDPARGCVDCAPGTSWCEGDDAYACTDGTPHRTETCDPAAGDRCRDGACVNACKAAADSSSYLGCEYWPTVTANTQLNHPDDFHFAIAVANPQKVSVGVKIERGEVPITRQLAPGEVAEIELPWVGALRQTPTDGFSQPESILVHRGAHRLTSTMPISAYQFNPLEYKVNGGECSEYNESSPCSYTNDASLLLPTSTLTGRYRVMAWPTISMQMTGSSVPDTSPGFIAIVATADATHVTIVSSAWTLAGKGIPPLGPGDQYTVTLDRGDALQVFSSLEMTPTECTELPPLGKACTGGPTYDLTGTRVEADQPVAVFGGHACAFVPFDRYACDHLEEQVFPFETWGTRVATVSTEPPAPGRPNVWKILSGSDGNTFSFDPEVHEKVTLDAGQYVEVTHDGAFEVRAGGPILVGQFMVGEQYEGLRPAGNEGDPSMGLAVPHEQYRRSYDFLAPDTYESNYVDVVARLGTSPVLDGTAVGPLEPIGSSEFGYARVAIPPGAHHIETTKDGETFGINVSASASYASYLFSGGLDLVDISVPK